MATFIARAVLDLGKMVVNDARIVEHLKMMNYYDAIPK